MSALGPESLVVDSWVWVLTFLLYELVIGTLVVVVVVKGIELFILNIIWLANLILLRSIVVLVIDLMVSTVSLLSLLLLLLFLNLLVLVGLYLVIGISLSEDPDKPNN